MRMAGTVAVSKSFSLTVADLTMLEYCKGEMNCPSLSEVVRRLIHVKYSTFVSNEDFK